MRTQLVNEVTYDTPISLQEAKQHLRNPENTEDSEILRFIQTARRVTEHKIGRKISAQVWDAFLDSFPANEIELPYGPLSSVEYVKYYDGADALQTVPSTNYTVDASSDLGRVVLTFGQTWPSVAPGLENAVVVRFTTGYANTDAIPPNVRHYMKLMIEELDKNRGLTTEKEVFLAPWAERLLDSERIVWVV